MARKRRRGYLSGRVDLVTVYDPTAIERSAMEALREEITEQILEAKRRKGLTFEALAEEMGAHKVWATAALLGQQPMSAEQAQRVVDVLDLDQEAAEVLQEIPMRGALEQDIPTDPTIYRLHEVVQVYGPTLKALIHEEFGDGIMSGINFGIDIERVEYDAGPSVRITMEGAFLPYNWQF